MLWLRRVPKAAQAVLLSHTVSKSQSTGQRFEAEFAGRGLSSKPRFLGRVLGWMSSSYWPCVAGTEQPLALFRTVDAAETTHLPA